MHLVTMAALRCDWKLANDVNSYRNRRDEWVGSGHNIICWLMLCILTAWSIPQVKELTCDTYKTKCLLKELPRGKAVVQNILLVYFRINLPCFSVSTFHCFSLPFIHPLIVISPPPPSHLLSHLSCLFSLLGVCSSYVPFYIPRTIVYTL